jgi:DNA-binding Lrp family transcriptional regulator
LDGRTCSPEVSVHVVDAPHHRVLRLLRDEGPVSRAELGDRLELTRPRLLAEVERLVAAGLIAEAGMAASRGGRRSTLVELHPRLRFAAVDLGASSIDIEVTNGRLEPVAAYQENADIRSGPKAILHRVNELLAKARTDGANGWTRSASGCPVRSVSATAYRCPRRSCRAGTATRCGNCWPVSTAARRWWTTT